MTSPQKNYESLMHALEAYRKSDPALYLHGLTLTADITAPAARFLRADALQAQAARLHATARLCDFPHEIVVRPEGVFVAVGGLLLESSQNAGYLKESGTGSVPQGEHMAGVLDRMNITPSTIVDIGANFGEISLILARAYPKARVLAVEASSDNIAVFETNRKAQRFPTQHIELVQVAVSDRSGTVDFTKGVSTMSHIAAPGEQNVETVACERLDTLLDRHGIATADFVKIDIEGAEPRLKDAVVSLGQRVRAYVIEFSQFAPLDDYIALAAALMAQGFACYDEPATARFASTDDIANHLRTLFAPSQTSVSNLWFFAPR